MAEVEVNHFVTGERKPTLTDHALAKAYYPLLIELAKAEKELTFKQFVEMAKKRYPNVEEVQNAIPVTTGRRFEFIRIYTNNEGLPDLSAWVVGQAGKNSEAYLADFDPKKEREETTKVDWDKFEGDWGKYLDELKIKTVKTKKRKQPEAEDIMSEYATTMRTKIEASIPNPKKLPYVKVVQPFRDPILEGLMEGKNVEDVFDDVIFDMTKSRSAEAL